MPITRKQKKARKSRGLDMLSDIENLDIMLGENHFERNERNESVNSNQADRPESLFGDEFEDENENVFPNPRNNGPSPNTELGHNSIRECSSVEINRLSSELNSRISREMVEMMNSVSVQIQRAINEAISSQILPQIQNVVMAGSGQSTKERWNVPAGRDRKGIPKHCKTQNPGTILRINKSTTVPKTDSQAQTLVLTTTIVKGYPWVLFGFVPRQHEITLK